MKRVNLLISMIVLTALLASCATPTAEVVEKVVTQVVKETVKETVIVEGTPQVVEKVVTKIVEKEVKADRWSGPGFGGELHAASAGNPPTADAPTTTAAATQYIAIHVHETLVAMSENYKLKPMLAESWDVSDDGKTYTFHLRQGVKFHNGEEMTADDVVASFKRFMEVSVRAASFSLVESYEATDKYTVVFKLSKPSRAFLLNHAYVYAPMCIQPKSVIEGKGVGELQVPEDIIGTGPYKLVQYDPDTVWVVERHKDYQPLPGERDGMTGAKIPYFDKIYMHIVPDYAVQVAGLESGEFDLIENFTTVSFNSLKDNPEITAVEYYPAVCGSSCSTTQKSSPAMSSSARRSLLPWTWKKSGCTRPAVIRPNSGSTPTCGRQREPCTCRTTPWLSHITTRTM